MNKVRIVSAAVRHPALRVTQKEAAARIVDAVGSRRRVEAIARGTGIDSRAVILPPNRIAELGSIEERNHIYEMEAPRLAADAARLLADSFDNISYLVTASCTGYMVPGLDVRLAQMLDLPPGASRLPITESGCAAGVVAIARATERLRAAPGTALAVSVELCSLAFHPDEEEGNLTSALLFGDGAGALLLQSDGADGSGLEVEDSASLLIPHSENLLGFRLTNAGFYPVLSRNLVDQLPGPTLTAVSSLLARNSLTTDDIDFWLIHPGGPRVLSALQRKLSIDADSARWSWQTLRQSGNTSSAAITEVIARFLDDAEAPRGRGVVLAFGPGVSIEALLVRQC